MRYQSRFVQELPEVGKLKGNPIDVFSYFKKGSKPITQKPYNLSPQANADREAIHMQVEQGLMRKMNDPNNKWRIPCFPVYKALNRRPRIVLACQKVNKLSNKDEGFVPITKETIDAIRRGRFRALLDAKFA